jgi:hypothetical protein
MKRNPFWDSLSLRGGSFSMWTQAVLYELASKGRVVIVGGADRFSERPARDSALRIISFEARVKRLVETGVEEKTGGQVPPPGRPGFLRVHPHLFHVDWKRPGFIRFDPEHRKDFHGDSHKPGCRDGPVFDISGKEEETREKLADLALMQKAEARLMDVLGTDMRQVEVEVKKGVVWLKGSVIATRTRENCERPSLPWRALKSGESA